MNVAEGHEHDRPYGIAPAGQRLPEATRPGGVTLQVADLERSLGFYMEVLGLRPLDRQGSRAMLGARGDDAPLVRLLERAEAGPVPRRGRLGLYHFAIRLPDRTSLGRFAAHLAERRVPAGASDHLVSEALYLHDPDGLGVEVYADRPRESWRHRDGQLVMATEPLDVPAVIRAGGGERWSGMPPGTGIGHLHLHVGDLAEAEVFYHDALGLDKIVWSYPGALFLSAGGYHHHLGLNTWAAGAAPAGPDDARLLEWELVVPDATEVDDALTRLEAAGYPVERQSGGGVVRDPWGTALRLGEQTGEPKPDSCIP